MIVESPIPQASPGARAVSVLGAVLLGVCLGCPALADNPNDGAAAAAPLPLPDPSPMVTPAYTVGAGDTIRVRVYEEDRLNGIYAVAQDATSSCFRKSYFLTISIGVSGHQVRGSCKNRCLRKLFLA